MNLGMYDNLSECTMGNITLGYGEEGKIAQSKAECYICIKTTPTYNISIVHERTGNNVYEVLFPVKHIDWPHYTH